MLISSSLTNRLVFKNKIEDPILPKNEILGAQLIGNTWDFYYTEKDLNPYNIFKT